MEQRHQTHSEMTQRCDRTLAVPGHFAWQGRARMKFVRMFLALHNPALLVSSVRQHLHLRKGQALARLHSNALKGQPIHDLHRKDFMLSIQARSNPQLAYRDFTRQQFKLINVSDWDVINGCDCTA